MIYPTIELEKSLWAKGYKNVVGIDEAGRGPLAGPVVAGAVVIHEEMQIVPEVRDSKKMTQKQRMGAFEKIKDLSTSWGVGIVDSEVIDEIGIQKAVLMAMKKALGTLTRKLKANPDFLIVDGKGVLLIDGYKMQKITKGDQNHYSIAAASVLAKVIRDNLMYEYALKYPDYGFESHMGYGTRYHLDALKRLGPCEIHRKSFRPVTILL